MFRMVERLRFLSMLVLQWSVPITFKILHFFWLSLGIKRRGPSFGNKGLFTPYPPCALTDSLGREVDNSINFMEPRVMSYHHQIEVNTDVVVGPPALPDQASAPQGLANPTRRRSTISLLSLHRPHSPSNLMETPWICLNHLALVQIIFADMTPMMVLLKTRHFKSFMRSTH
ncbi:hypothetical protein EDD22DRAFT_868701 [Suillus occidentalis]|nr:hypothetical protein EDD22DRAFT_868701 [Suillus occidentalis]